MECACGEKSFYVCCPCKVAICKNHKLMHEDDKQRVHRLEKLTTIPNSQQIEEIIENLSSKISLANECEQLIIKETDKLAAKIKCMSMQALEIIKQKKQKYANLLIHIQEGLFYDAITQESKIPLSISIPKCDFKEIEDFYQSDFLTDSENISRILSIPLEEAKLILSQDYGLFLQAHTDPVTCVAITSDDKYIVSGSWDNTVRIWNLQSKTQKSVLQGHTKWVTSVSITSDNKYIVSASNDDTVRIWNIEQEIQEGVIQGEEGCILSVAVTSDSKYIITGGYDSTLIIWSFQKKSQEAILEGHTDSILILVTTSDSKYAISGSDDKTIRIWDIQDRKQEAILEGHSNQVTGLAVTSDNRYIISCGNDKTVRIWNLQSRRQEWALEEQIDKVVSVAVSRDNKYIITADMIML